MYIYNIIIASQSFLLFFFRKKKQNKIPSTHILGLYKYDLHTISSCFDAHTHILDREGRRELECVVYIELYINFDPFGKFQFSTYLIVL